MSKPSDFATAKTTDFDAIPVIDLGGGTAPERLAKQLIKTAEDIGFFYLTNHGIPTKLTQTAFAASRRFFELPEEKKASVAVNTQQRGWMAQGMTRLEGSKTHDAKEVFFWGWPIAPDDSDLADGFPLVAENQWPHDQAPWLQRDLMPYYKAVATLSREVLGLIALGLGQNRDFFEPHYAKPLARGQLVYYPPSASIDESEQRFGAAAHSDFGVLTMLSQDMQGGLQVQNKAGDWIEAPPIENSIVCNIGDLLERWTNGRLVSTKHRVINRAKTARYSIPIFCDPASQTPIDPRDFDASLKPENAIITAGEHIAGRNSKNFSQYKS